MSLFKRTHQGSWKCEQNEHACHFVFQDYDLMRYHKVNSKPIVRSRNRCSSLDDIMGYSFVLYNTVVTY